MREIEIHDYARQLVEAHGAKAIAEAAQNAIDLEVKGEVELARTWRHIEAGACRKLNPGILVMQSAQGWATKNVPGAIDGARDRCIFLQG
jgi:hypothetical protein